MTTAGKVTRPVTRDGRHLSADLADEIRARLQRHDVQPLPPAAARRAIREAAGLSARDLADVLGVTGQSIRNWEAGRCDPQGEHRTRYREALDVLATAGPHPSPRRLRPIGPTATTHDAQEAPR